MRMKIKRWALLDQRLGAVNKGTLVLPIAPARGQTYGAAGAEEKSASRCHFRLLFLRRMKRIRLAAHSGRPDWDGQTGTARISAAR
jgi:hypothetical protein